MFWHQPKADPGMRLHLHFSIKLHIVALGKGSELWLYVHWWVRAKFPVHITQAITQITLSSLCKRQMSVTLVLSDCCGFQSHQKHITFKRTNIEIYVNSQSFPVDHDTQGSVQHWDIFISHRCNLVWR